MELVFQAMESWLGIFFVMGGCLEVEAEWVKDRRRQPSGQALVY